MKFQETKLKGSYLINHDNHNDKRGFFERIFCQKTFQTFLKEKNIRQINHSFTKKKEQYVAYIFNIHLTQKLK